MHKNTIIIIGVLAILATLLVGINIGRKVGGTQLVQVLPSPVINPTNSPTTAQIVPKTFVHPNCDVSFSYDPKFELSQASDSATLADSTNQEVILLVCGSDFPKPALLPEKTEEATIAGQLATVYHDARAQDGKPIDVVIFDHPTNGLEIALFGFGKAFEDVLKTLLLLP